jgi:hypothetical protein
MYHTDLTRDQKKQAKTQLLSWYGGFIKLGKTLKVFESFGIFIIFAGKEYPCRIVVMDIINMSRPTNVNNLEVFNLDNGFKPEVLFKILNTIKHDPDQAFNVESSEDEDFQPNPY